MMETEILNNFSEYLEKQDILNKLIEKKELHNYGYSEIHIIVKIQEISDPNVTALAKALNMTKGAISKIIKKLTANGLVETYQKPDNRQKIFYRLTAEGVSLYEMHAQRHASWEERDLRFFSRFSQEELVWIKNFMKAYNNYLAECIYEIEKETT